MNTILEKIKKQIVDNSKLIPFVVLFLSLSLSLYIWVLNMINVKEKANNQLEFKVKEIGLRIEQKIITHENLLNFVAAFFINSEEVTRDEFHFFIKALNLKDNYSSVLGIGYSKIVKYEELENHIKGIKAEGFPNYSVFPKGDRKIYTPIIYLEPFTNNNIRAFGYDMYADSTRREALILAAQTNKLVVSGKVILQQDENTNNSSSFLMYMPIYNNKKPHSNIKEREENIIGWIFAPIRIKDLLNGIFTKKDKIVFQLFDEDENNINNLMFSSIKNSNSKSSLETTTRIYMGGRSWVLKVAALNNFMDDVEDDHSFAILIIFILGSFLLFVISYILTNAHSKSLFSENQNKKIFDFLMNYANTAIIIFDYDRTIIEVNSDACMYYGYSETELLGGKIELLFPHELRDNAVAKFDLLKSVEFLIFESLQKRKDGSTISTEIDLRTFLIDNKECVIGFIRNTNSQNVSELELKESHSWLQSILNTLTVGVVIIDAETHTIFDINPVATKMIGDKKENIIGSPCQQFICPNSTNSCPIIDYNKNIDKAECVLVTANKDTIPIYKSVTKHEFNNKTYLIESIVDISENISLQKELIKARNNFDLFFNTIQDMLFVLDMKGNILHVNNTTCKRLGYTSDELIGKLVLSVHPAEFYDEARGIIKDMISGKIEFCPLPVETKSGKRIQVETRVIKGEWDNQPAIFGVAKDVSSLRLSQEKFSKAFNLSPVVMAISKKTDGTFIEINEAFSKVIGYSPEEVLTRTSDELKIFANNREFQKIKLQLLSGLNVSNVELKVSTKSGEVIIGQFSMTDIVINEEPCWLTSMIDVTLLRNATEALKLSEKKYRTIFENVQDIFYQTDLYGYILDISPSITKYTNFTREYLIGKNVSIVYKDPNDRAILISLLKEKKEVEDHEIVLIDDKNNERITSVNAHFIFDINGQPIGIEGALRDITARKNAELKLKEYADELKNVNAQKDKFFSIISHDLRGPLGGVKGMIEILLDDNESFTQKELREFYLELHKSISMQSSLLEDLLEWSRIQSNRLPLIKNHLNCNIEVTYVLDLLKQNALFKRITIKKEINPELEVYADSNMFQLVLRNLISNAIKFSYENTEINVTAKEENSFTVFCVSDNGVGLSKKNIEKLFRLDVQITTDGTKKEKGTGIGLILCKEIITKHNGDIWVESEAGKGSKFFFSFPVIEKETIQE